MWGNLDGATKARRHERLRNPNEAFLPQQAQTFAVHTLRSSRPPGFPLLPWLAGALTINTEV
jgi:hypothetical protein